MNIDVFEEQGLKKKTNQKNLYFPNLLSVKKMF